MRPITIIVVGLVSVFCAAQSPPASPPASIVVRVWTDSANATKEDAFSIDLSTRKSTSHISKRIPSNEKPEWTEANIIDRARNLHTYERIVERFKGTPNQSNGSDLAEAMRWLEQNTKGTGYEPEDFVVASADGKHAVIKGPYQPLLLIDVATLNTHRLLDNPGDQTPIVAWSADSRYVAFTSLKSRELSVYNVAQNATSVMVPNAPWIEELSWSPDGQLIAAFALKNRRIDKNPLAVLVTVVGHPMFKNDAVLVVYRFGGASSEGEFSVPLKRGILEQSTPRARVEWK
jgi:WD40 repeat protein